MPPLKGAGTAQAVTGGCLTEVSVCADVSVSFCRGRVSRPGVPSALKPSICGIGGVGGVGGAAGGGTPPLRVLTGVQSVSDSAAGAHIGAPLRVLWVVRKELPPLKGAGTAQAVTGGCLTEVSVCVDVFIAFCRGRVSRPGVPSALKSSICGIGGAAGGGTPPLRILLMVRCFHRGCGAGSVVRRAVDNRPYGLGRRCEKIAPFEGGWHGASRDWGLPDGSFCQCRCFRFAL